MNIAFTLCSNNYLAHAKTTGDSFLQFHPDFIFFIGLVDKQSKEIEEVFFSKFTIVPVDQLHITAFSTLASKYNITELNTAVKPSYYHYLFTKYQASNVIYIDPDILVTSRFTEVIDILKEKNIVVTPHITKPIDDEFMPTDYHTLRGGIFNLGFIALSNYEKVKDFLNWWHERVIKYGFANFASTMFYDQLWINYVPAFYDNYHILKHPGYNMANWNLHERQLSKNSEGNYCVNKVFDLRFFHFSSYKYNKPDVICSYLTRYDFNNRPDLKDLFATYQALLKKNKVETIMDLDVFYYPNLKKNIGRKRTLVEKIYSRIYRSLKVLTTGHG